MAANLGRETLTAAGNVEVELGRKGFVFAFGLGEVLPYDLFVVLGVVLDLYKDNLASQLLVLSCWCMHSGRACIPEPKVNLGLACLYAFSRK